jgi:hypothetical protein
MENFTVTRNDFDTNPAADKLSVDENGHATLDLNMDADGKASETKTFTISGLTAGSKITGIEGVSGNLKLATSNGAQYEIDIIGFKAKYTPDMLVTARYLGTVEQSTVQISTRGRSSGSSGYGSGGGNFGTKGEGAGPVDTSCSAMPENCLYPDRQSADVAQAKLKAAFQTGGTETYLKSLVADFCRQMPESVGAIKIKMNVVVMSSGISVIKCSILENTYGTYGSLEWSADRLAKKYPDDSASILFAYDDLVEKASTHLATIAKSARLPNAQAPQGIKSPPFYGANYEFVIIQ